MAGSEYDPVMSTPLAKLRADNVHQTTNRIMGFLHEVAQLSHSNVGIKVENEIHEIVNLSLDIALQFGVHAAQLQLLSPGRGERIEIGEDFHHCEDADYCRGSTYTVDLVILPGLKKIGDGRSDMSSRRTIIPCEIYPE
jgi:hypothetical protein